MYIMCIMCIMYNVYNATQWHSSQNLFVPPLSPTWCLLSPIQALVQDPLHDPVVHAQHDTLSKGSQVLSVFLHSSFIHCIFSSPGISLSPFPFFSISNKIIFILSFHVDRQGHLISGLVNGNGYHTIMSSGTTTNWIRANYFSGKAPSLLPPESFSDPDATFPTTNTSTGVSGTADNQVETFSRSSSLVLLGHYNGFVRPL